MLSELIRWEALKQTQIDLLAVPTNTGSILLLLSCWVVFSLIFVEQIIATQILTHLPHLEAGVFTSSGQVVATRAEFGHPDRVRMRHDLLHSIQVQIALCLA